MPENSKIYQNSWLSLFKKGFFTIIIIFFSVFAKAQNNPEIIIEQILEHYIENSSEEVDFSDLQEDLLNLINNPISINNASKDELKSLFFLTEIQIQDILEYRRKYLFIASIYELGLIKSIDKTTLQNLIPFFTFDPKEKPEIKLKDVIERGKHQVLTRYETVLENKAGYSIEYDSNNPNKQYYLGSPAKLYTRYNYELYNKISFGITMEKDPGEQFFKGNQKYGFDFYSAHLFIRGNKKLKQLAIGDFTSNFGQGLILQTGFAFSKSPNILDIYRSNEALSPYRSVNESSFLRGAGITYQIGKTNITGFVSAKKIDGNVLNDTMPDVETQLTSFYNTGYHRTQNEYDKKKSVDENLVGIRISRSFNRLKIGLNSIAGKYSPGLTPSGKPYQKYYFSGKNFSNSSIDHSYSYKNLFLFGELATDYNSYALLQGLFINLSSTAQGGLLYRNYNKSYVANYANSFSEGNRTQNENGFFLAISMNPFQNIKLNTYADVFNFPWLRYQVNLPSQGFEYFLDLTYTPSFYSKFYFRMRYEEKEKNSSENTQLKGLATYERLNLRFNYDHRINRYLKLKSRIEYSRYNSESIISEGMLSFIDASLNSYNYKWRLSARYGIFNIDNYDARIYTYENDILYSFSIPSFSGVGNRYYLVLRYRANNKITFWGKIARTQYFDRNEIGSGLEKIPESHKTDFKIMLRYSF